MIPYVAGVRGGRGRVVKQEKKKMQTIISYTFFSKRKEGKEGAKNVPLLFFWMFCCG